MTTRPWILKQIQDVSILCIQFLLIAFSILPSSLHAATPYCPKHQRCITNLSASDVLSLIAKDIDEQRYDEAGILLLQLNTAGARHTEQLFLQGRLALETKNYNSAIEKFRLILTSEPKLTRVRLELARALFLKNDDEAADYHFRLALADRPPPEVVINIQTFRQIIRNRRSWSGSFDIGLAPDTNINAATSGNDYTLFGIPAQFFTVTPKTSGIGLTQSADGTWRPYHHGKFALVLAAFDQLTVYRVPDYNEILVGGDVGVEWKTPHGNFTASATGYQRWYGRHPYVYTPGAKLAFESVLSKRWQVGSQLVFRDLTYARNAGLNGQQFSLAAQANYAINATSYAFGTAEVQRETARDAGYANWESHAGLGYGRELPYGITATLYSEAGYAGYDAPQAVFGKTRRDIRLRNRLSITKRNWTVWGLAPRITYTYTRVFSSIGYYSYTRQQTDLGFTHIF